PSANRFGRVSPTTAQHVLDELDARIPLIIDAGPTEHGIESTIISVRGNSIDILRRGPVTAEQLSQFAKVNIVSSPPGKISAPGQLPSHYAPRTRLRVVESAESFSPPKNQRIGLLAWYPVLAKEDLQSTQKRTGDGRWLKFVAIRNLSAHQDL